MNQKGPTRESLQMLKRVSLQKLCKSLFIKGANKKSVEIIEVILAHYAQKDIEVEEAKQIAPVIPSERAERVIPASRIEATKRAATIEATREPRTIVRGEGAGQAIETDVRETNITRHESSGMENPRYEDLPMLSVVDEDKERLDLLQTHFDVRLAAHRRDLEERDATQWGQIEKRTAPRKSIVCPQKKPIFEIYRDPSTPEQNFLAGPSMLGAAPIQLLTEQLSVNKNVLTVMESIMPLRGNKVKIRSHPFVAASMASMSKRTRCLGSQLLAGRIRKEMNDRDQRLHPRASLSVLGKRQRLNDAKSLVFRVSKRLSSLTAVELSSHIPKTLSVLGKRAREPTFSIPEYEFADEFSFPLPPVLRLATPPIMDPHKDPWPSVGPLLSEPPKKSPSFSKKPKRLLVFEGCALTYIGMMKPGFVPSLEQVESRKSLKCWVAVASGQRGAPCSWIQKHRPPFVQSEREAKDDERRRQEAICWRPKSVFSDGHVEFAESYYEGCSFNNYLEMVGYYPGFPKSILSSSGSMRALSLSSSSSSSAWLSFLPASNHNTSLFTPNSHDPKNFPKSITHYLGDIIVTKVPCKKSGWFKRVPRDPGADGPIRGRVAWDA
ncbi:hypothetical protein [Phaffia rhodozyma]|uniref:Uncharacterized protein n=1 Tax=Phaffia rhodozyma TaxID=264483 RepID=A0A0F7SJH4_PHARH|nr:hypothetical protein [Phaffia rhodozyma]